MDEKDKQLCETTFAVESAKQAAKLGKDVASDIVRPTSKSIGENIGLLVDGVFGWLGVWGQMQKIRQEKNLEEFKKEINKNIEAIPQDNLKEPTMYIIGPAIEASKYYYEEAQFKEMFAKLIAASCDDRDNDKISPYFVEAIKQISHKEAMILTLFRDKKTSALPIVNYRLILKTIGEKYYEKYVFIHDNPDNIRKYSDSLINLQRLGLVSLDFQNWLTDNNFYQIYKDNVFFKNTKQEILKNIENPDFECRDFDIQKGILELTPLGKNFIDLCL
ncbi:DUF4393 domain-containing protein [Faecalibacillus sp. MSK20_93]|uniref:DUF4393 domain-containing protein n=1 Tax=Faecalibacillus sp. MSK20_93 TaxID=2884903 RepID=UPI001D0A524A|nr:DUF4393 domain-containing protein [Faecalibacillus sp. MSK20_93]MCB7509874.1 DUF4393 domain-containing protein [bacterium MSK20_81]MCB8549495.1 DUF4393 domain-containing protein [Faecalibacillus sp. MSK20_93]